MRTYLVISIVLLALSAQADGSGQRDRRVGGYFVYGMGDNTCGSYVLTRSATDREAPFQWVLGFVTAHDRINRGAFKETDSDAVEAWLMQYCKANPLEYLHVAAQHLVIELGDTTN